MKGEMVERVARAICKEEYGDENAGWENQIPAARAAIAAVASFAPSFGKFMYSRHDDGIASWALEGCGESDFEDFLKGERKTS